MAGVGPNEHDSYYAYLAEGNARQARKRVAADVLIRDQEDRVLLVDPTYKSSWDLPCGMVEANESPQTAAARELREELNLHIPIGRRDAHLDGLPDAGIGGFGQLSDEGGRDPLSVSLPGTDDLVVRTSPRGGHGIRPRAKKPQCSD